MLKQAVLLLLYFKGLNMAEGQKKMWQCYSVETGLIDRINREKIVSVSTSECIACNGRLDVE
jgi:hypothetical protein